MSAKKLDQEEKKLLLDSDDENTTTNNKSGEKSSSNNKGETRGSSSMLFSSSGDNSAQISSDQQIAARMQEIEKREADLQQKNRAVEEKERQQQSGNNHNQQTTNNDNNIQQRTYSITYPIELGGFKVDNLTKAERDDMMQEIAAEMKKYREENGNGNNNNNNDQATHNDSSSGRVLKNTPNVMNTPNQAAAIEAWAEYSPYYTTGSKLFVEIPLPGDIKKGKMQYNEIHFWVALLQKILVPADADTDADSAVRMLEYSGEVFRSMCSSWNYKWISGRNPAWRPHLIDHGCRIVRWLKKYIKDVSEMRQSDWVEEYNKTEEMRWNAAKKQKDAAYTPVTRLSEELLKETQKKFKKDHFARVCGVQVPTQSVTVFLENTRHVAKVAAGFNLVYAKVNDQAKSKIQGEKFIRWLALTEQLCGLTTPGTDKLVEWHALLQGCATGTPERDKWINPHASQNETQKFFKWGDIFVDNQDSIAAMDNYTFVFESSDTRRRSRENSSFPPLAGATAMVGSRGGSQGTGRTDKTCTICERFLAKSNALALCGDNPDNLKAIKEAQPLHRAHASDDKNTILCARFPGLKNADEDPVNPIFGSVYFEAKMEKQELRRKLAARK